jgi:hypothetical protein
VRAPGDEPDDIAPYLGHRTFLMVNVLGYLGYTVVIEPLRQRPRHGKHRSEIVRRHGAELAGVGHRSCTVLSRPPVLVRTPAAQVPSLVGGGVTVRGYEQGWASLLPIHSTRDGSEGELT